ncbi:MAG: YihA family ribosome biogenesis GTP-binding protein [Saprospiraceae bacterium]|nr:MAG: GTP-binding protein YsxC [Bacteroidetes bacterium OLB9]MCO6464241.1 YihA family ribosome biogenesis GTP-binding protein [Saprospiraceae bacterium]MCZ2339096.1 ribosome biogenesis GTP-binding protein YihA/YsxC [Chitinophagales bacterium]
MNFREVNFVASFPKESACPKEDKPEFAFIGRSNVGKSSLINMLTGKKALAKVSVTPGKTQLINYFDIDGEWHLVDLPGYGYAKVSKDKKQVFSKMINDYLLKRKQLFIAFVLIDSRHELQKIDKTFIDWCGENEIPFAIIFTKADKLGKTQLDASINKILKELKKVWEILPPYFITSSETKLGRENVLNYIAELLETIH